MRKSRETKKTVQSFNQHGIQKILLKYPPIFDIFWLPGLNPLQNALVSGCRHPSFVEEIGRDGRGMFLVGAEGQQEQEGEKQKQETRRKRRQEQKDS